MLGKGMHRTKIRLLMAAALLGLAAVIPASITAPAALAKADHHGLPELDGMRIHPGPKTGDPFTLKNWSDGMCLGIAANAYEGDAVQWKCNGSTNQSWAYGAELGSTGFYQLVNGNNSCLGILGGSTANGAQVVGWQCLATNPANQFWYWGDYLAVVADCIKANGDVYTYYWPLNNWAVDGDVAGVNRASTAEGADIVNWQYQTECNNQAWSDGYSVIITHHGP
jgi:hypothetical protein